MLGRVQVNGRVLIPQLGEPQQGPSTSRNQDNVPDAAAHKGTAKVEISPLNESLANNLWAY
jgi:hypothetical protein